MQKTARIALVAAAIAATVVFLVPSEASAQVRVEGRFRLPHGDVAVSVGDPYYRGHYGYHRYPVGSYVPYGHRVHRRQRFGYGFYSPAFACRAHRVRHAHWVPVRRHHTRWVVVQQPVLVEQRYYGDRYYDDEDSDEDSDDGYRERRRYRGRGEYRDPYAYRDPYDHFNRMYADPEYRNRYRHVHTDSCDHDD